MNKLFKTGLVLTAAVIFSLFGFSKAFGYGGGGVTSSAPAPVVTAINVPLSLSGTQEGTLVQNNDGLVTRLVVTPGTISGNATFAIMTSSDSAAVGGAIFNINASDLNGNQVHNFSNNLNITLSGLNLPADVSGLGVYYFNETTSTWTLVPGATFNADGSVSFSVNHLTKFAVFAKNSVPTVSSNQAVLGVQKYSVGSLLRSKETGKIHVIIANGTLQYVPNMAELMKYHGRATVTVSESVIASYNQVLGAKKYADGTLLRAKGDVKIFVVINGVKVHIKSLAELHKYAGHPILETE
jgi:hypothetical protein